MIPVQVTMRIALCLVACIIPANGFVFGAVIYTLVERNIPSNQPGFAIRVGGTITVSDTAASDGLLSINEILAWDIFEGRFTSLSSDAFLTLLGPIKITSTEIRIPQASNSTSSVAGFSYGLSPASQVFFAYGDINGIGGGSMSARLGEHSGSLSVPNSERVHAFISAVPEPSAFSLLAAFGVGMACLGVRKLLLLVFESLDIFLRTPPFNGTRTKQRVRPRIYFAQLPKFSVYKGRSDRGLPGFSQIALEGSTKAES